MSPGDDHHDTTCPCPCQDAAAAANNAIRRHVAGRIVWTPEALAELDRLWAAWRDATARGMTTTG